MWQKTGHSVNWNAANPNFDWEMSYYLILMFEIGKKVKVLFRNISDTQLKRSENHKVCM